MLRNSLVIHKRILYYWVIPFFSHLSHGKFWAAKRHSWRPIHKCGVNTQGIWLLMLWQLLEQVWAALQSKLFHSDSAFPCPVLLLIFLHLSLWHGRSCHQPRLPHAASGGRTGLEWAKSNIAGDDGNSQAQLSPCVTEVSDLLNSH